MFLVMILTGIGVFFARLLDVSLSTVKLKAIMRGNKTTAFFIAFFEVLIYMLAASLAFKYINNQIILFFYCLGYASGNYLGVIIDEKLAKGDVLVLVISDHDEDTISLADHLRNLGYGVTTDKGYGLSGNPKLQLKIITPRKKLKELKGIIDEFNKDKSMFVSILEVKETQRITPKV